MCGEYTFYYYCGHVHQKTTIPCERWTSAISSTKSKDVEPNYKTAIPLDRVRRISCIPATPSSSTPSSSTPSLSSQSQVSFRAASDPATSIEPTTPPSPVSALSMHHPCFKEANVSTQISNIASCPYTIPLPRLFPHLCSQCQNLAQISDWLSRSPAQCLEAIQGWHSTPTGPLKDESPAEEAPSSSCASRPKSSTERFLLALWLEKKAKMQAFAGARKVAADALRTRVGIDIGGVDLKELVEEDKRRKEEDVIMKEEAVKTVWARQNGCLDPEVAKTIPGWDETW